MPGKGKQLLFHGAFGTKSKARDKVRTIKGSFIKERTMKGQKRFVVMSERSTNKRRNVDPKIVDAAQMSEKFHGRPARKVTTHKERVTEPDTLADLGRLLNLKVHIGPNHDADFDFTGNIRVACTSDGGQIYFVGGRQAIDLKALRLDHLLPKDHVLIGDVRQITYYTCKVFHDFEPIRYYHNFGDEGGERPMLMYDVHNRLLYLVGGSYQVKPEGISN